MLYVCCVRLCVCLHVSCVCMLVCVSLLCTCTCTRARVCVHAFVNAYVSVSVYEHMHVHMCLCMCECVLCENTRYVTCIHLVSPQGCKTSIYASPWFLTLFSSSLSLNVAFRIMDIFFLDVS